MLALLVAILPPLRKHVSEIYTFEMTNFGKPRQVDNLKSGDRDQPGQHDETPSLLKIQKISWAWWQVPVTQLFRRLRQENCLNWGGGGCTVLDAAIIEALVLLTGLDDGKGNSGVVPCSAMRNVHIDTLHDSTHFGRPRRADHLRSGVRDQLANMVKTLSLLKIQKLSRCALRSQGLAAPPPPTQCGLRSPRVVSPRAIQEDPAIAAASSSSTGSQQERRDLCSTTLPSYQQSHSTWTAALSKAQGTQKDLSLQSGEWVPGYQDSTGDKIKGIGTPPISWEAKLGPPLAQGYFSNQEAEAGGSRGQEIETILANMLLGRLRQENYLNLGSGGCSELRSCHCTSAWRQSKTPSQKKKKEAGCCQGLAP
ncbi:hypothetical protein AAY473_016592 [Plecturocebus cupreus]